MQDIARQATDLAVALHACGAPTHLIEERLDAYLDQLGAEGTVVATPTALWLQIGSGAAVVRTRPGGLELGRLGDLQRWLDMDPGDRPALAQLLARPGAWSPATQHLAFVTGTASAGALLGQGWIDVVAAAGAGLAVRTGLHALRGSAWAPLQDVLAGMIAGIVGAASALLGASPLAVAMAGVIVLVPGLGLTVAASELTAGMWTAGTTRLVAAALTSAQLAAGLALGAQLIPRLPVALTSSALPPALEPVLVLGIAPASFGILLGIRPRDLPPVVVISAVGFLVAAAVGGGLGAGVAAGLVGLASAVLAHTRGGSSLASIVPGVLLLVPGSIGVRSAELALHHDTLGAMGLAADALGIAGALAMGLAAAQALWARYPARPERRPHPTRTSQPHSQPGAPVEPQAQPEALPCAPPLRPSTSSPVSGPGGVAPVVVPVGASEPVSVGASPVSSGSGSAWNSRCPSLPGAPPGVSPPTTSTGQGSSRPITRT